jgi:putative ATPase
VTDLNLFPESEPPLASALDGEPGPGPGSPLAARMRPRTMEEFRGQEHVLGPGKALRSQIERGDPGSMILWGPPGSGKTTLARLVAEKTDATFVSFSAVTEGVARVREVIKEAKERRRATNRNTILFCDEIHRFNKAQQDAFLPHVESGTVVLIGATTENPSFEIVRPLLSRAPVFALKPLSPEDVGAILRDALVDAERGLGGQELRVDSDALEAMAHAADGDARRGLGILETAAKLVGNGGSVDLPCAEEAVQHRFSVYDKSGEEHFNLISALHKAVRGGSPDGALYWLARMLEGGEDPLYIARRLVRMASEDIGLAAPGALAITIAARDAYRFLGAPEGELALAEATVYLATAPKSNRTYVAWKAARQSAKQTPSAPVPLQIRNAPTELMKDLGYGEGYRYDPDESGGVASQEYLPDGVAGQSFYRPGSAGFEESIKARLERWSESKNQARRSEADNEESSFPPS